MTESIEIDLLPETLVGRTVAGKYAVESLLGSGAMGQVYKARQIALDKVVALKVMHAAVASDPTFVERFEREAKAASRLDHPNSIRVMDFGKDPDGLTYLAMEFVEGRNLHDTIASEWPLSTARIANLLMQATSALAVAHKMGVVHRDLKPENLMVVSATDEDGRRTDTLKVLDFGIAKIMSKGGGTDGGRSKTAAGLVIGTPEYMSPEQCRGETVDAQTDIYSLGVILFELLTGTVPFTADTPLGIVVKHVTAEAPRPLAVNPSADPRLDAICVKAMQKTKAARYQSVLDLRADVRALVQGLPSSPALITGRPNAPTEPVAAVGPLVTQAREASGSREAATILSHVSANPSPTGRAKPPRWLELTVLAVLVFGVSRFAVAWVRGQSAPSSASTETPAGTSSVAAAATPQGVPTSTASPGETSATAARESAPHVEPSGPALPAVAASPTIAEPAVDPVKGRASVRVTQVAGSTDAAIIAVLPVGRYQDCYQKELRRTKKRLEGHADLKLEFLSSGSITSAQGLASPELSKVGQCCAEATLHTPRGLQGVDAKGGTANVTIEYTLD